MAFAFKLSCEQQHKKIESSQIIASKCFMKPDVDVKTIMKLKYNRYKNGRNVAKNKKSLIRLKTSTTILKTGVNVDLGCSVKKST